MATATDIAPNIYRISIYAETFEAGAAIETKGATGMSTAITNTQACTNQSWYLTWGHLSDTSS
jgi:hypothetical protein